MDEELTAFETRFWTHLQYSLFVNISFAFWEEYDELDNNALLVIENAVNSIFAQMIHVYRDTAAGVYLFECRLIIHHALQAAMNVPYPREPAAHVHRVVRNMVLIFVRTTYAPLRTAMIMLDHHARVIQRVWKRAVSDPAGGPCRRRLLREFRSLEPKFTYNTE